jgi:glycylpeptide N-tetradecanoyltransferase
MNYPKNLETALKWNYKFWSTQPVPKLQEKSFIDGPITNNLSPTEIRLTPYELVEGFEWVSIDFNKDAVEISEFLDKYYVEDSNNQFRLHYSPDFLKWIYGCSEYVALAVRFLQNKMIVGFICGKSVKMQINKNKLDMIEINLLCIHPKLRTKRLAPILIKEITRQYHLKDYFYGLFTSSIYLPNPIITTKYYHRPINLDTLLDTKFTSLDPTHEPEHIKKVLSLPNKNSRKFKKMELEHLDDVYDLFNKYMEKYNYHPLYSKDEFTYIFLNNNFVFSYVFEDENGNIIDFASYYTIQVKVLKNNEKHQFINKAHLFYYTCNEVTPYKVINELLIAAKLNNIDVMDALDIMENEAIIKELKFEEGTGLLHYYLYNWKTKPLKNLQISSIFF